MRSIQTVLLQDGSKLKEVLALTAGEARLEVQLLLQQALGVARAYLIAHAEQELNATQQSAYCILFQRRLQGEPIAYILGEREFFGLNLKLTTATLIPRPETELLVEMALQFIPVQKQAQILDLGTGSGAIALALAHARPEAQVMAVDASEAALQVARANAARLGITNVQFQHSNWFTSLAGQQYDLIVSNPPYIASNDRHLGCGDVRFEPISALASGEDGLDDIRQIVEHAAAFLEPEAWLLLEHGYDQAAQVVELLKKAGFTETFSVQDLAGIERVSGGKKLN